MHLHELDIKTAFLNGEVDEEIYLQPPQGIIFHMDSKERCGG
jgi:hypothetical protein